MNRTVTEMLSTFKIVTLTCLSCVALAATTVVTSAQEREKSEKKKLPIVTTSPTLNFYGVPGLVDLPNAEALESGQIAIGVSHFGGQTRSNLTFQFSKRASGTVRYIGIRNYDDDGFDTYRDRSFDFRYQLTKEGKYRPAITVGLQDLAGTGIYAAEYLVATKSFYRPFLLPGRFKVTGGLGWGRLGSLGDIGTLAGGPRPVFSPTNNGGQLATSQWFRGPTSPFGGIEWQVNDRFGLKAEISSDGYEPETSRGVFEHRSRVNFGGEYQLTRRLRLGAYWLYGSEVGFNAQFQLNPKQPVTPFTVAAPPQVIVRPTRDADPAAYDTAWAAAQGAPVQARDTIGAELLPQGIRLESISVSATRVEARVSSITFDNLAIVAGRTARALARNLPASVETFDVVLVNRGLSLSNIRLSRTDIETLEFQPGSSDALLARAEISDATPDPEADAVYVETNFPRFSYSLGPFVRPSYFDPEVPIRVDAGVSLKASYRFAPGLKVEGELRYRVVGNIADSERLSNSALPPVRTDVILFAQGSDLTFENLYLSKQWKPGRNTYARVTGGYLEQMFGGVSAELLWKPVSSRLGLGVELNYARKREFDQQFGFQGFDVFTGHASAYYDIGNGYFGQIDAGRFLAKDVGATFSVERQFSNGFRIGGFFTLTNVSSEDFGEGSFDKGITFTVPLTWLLGKPSKQVVSSTIRPILRDGGARLVVPDRLFEQIRDGHSEDLVGDWGRVWE